MSKPPFFIGWQKDVPAPLHGFLRRLVLGLALLGGGVSWGLAAWQGRVGSGKFEFGSNRVFQGLLLSQPVPLLITSQPVEGQSVFYLVDPLKQGFSPALAAGFHLQAVTLTGTLIHDDEQGMIEVTKGSLARAEGIKLPAVPEEVVLGAVTLRGEIVDSKCHLGVMNPGSGKGHRACAIHCIRGGVPPILVVAKAQGGPSYYLLTGAQGQMINAEVLDFVAEAVELSGQLEIIAGLQVVRVDLTTLKRI